MIKRGSAHSRQYLAMVMRPLMPICMAPSPTKAIATRSGKQNLAAVA
jgi:hypothetical protein